MKPMYCVKEVLSTLFASGVETDAVHISRIHATSLGMAIKSLSNTRYGYGNVLRLDSIIEREKHKRSKAINIEHAEHFEVLCLIECK